MSVKREIARGGWLVQRADEGALSIARNEWSDWIEVPISDVEQLIADLRSLAMPAPKPEVATPPEQVGACLKCGIRFDHGAMGYVCGDIACPLQARAT